MVRVRSRDRSWEGDGRCGGSSSGLGLLWLAGWLAGRGGGGAVLLLLRLVSLRRVFLPRCGALFIPAFLPSFLPRSRRRE